MIYVLALIFLVLCAGIILLVMMQPGKSGGMGGLGGGSAGGAITESLGATHAEKTLAQWTSYGIAIFFIMALLMTLVANRRGSSQLNLAAEQPGTAVVPTGPAPAEGGAAAGGSSAPAPAPVEP